jgi:hypothetical protein
MSLQRLTENEGPGLADSYLAELGGINAVRVARVRYSPRYCRDSMRRGPGFYSRALVGLYHISWGK